MRLFIALAFSPALHDWLAEAQSGLRLGSESGNFSRPENLHLTLHFLGEVSGGRVAPIRAAMERVTVPPFPLTLGGVGMFRREGSNIGWLGIEKNEALASLHAQLAKNLRAVGFPVESRFDTPHLTLGREIVLHEDFRKEDLEKSLGKRQDQVGSILLMKSERIQRILRYTPLFEKQLSEV